MVFPGVRLSIRSMMIGIAALSILIATTVRLIHAGLPLVVCICFEQQELKFMEESLNARRSPVLAEYEPVFAEYDKKVAAYHAQKAAYFSECKWLYLPSIFEVWVRIPNLPLEPQGLVHPEISEVPPPRTPSSSDVVDSKR
jgi:hypothetical protein